MNIKYLYHKTVKEKVLRVFAEERMKNDTKVYYWDPKGLPCFGSKNEIMKEYAESY